MSYAWFICVFIEYHIKISVISCVNKLRRFSTNISYWEISFTQFIIPNFAYRFMVVSVVQGFEVAIHSINSFWRECYFRIVALLLEMLD